MPRTRIHIPRANTQTAPKENQMRIPTREEHLTQPQQLEPDFSFRHVKPTGAQTITQGRPDAGALGARQTRILQPTSSAIGCSCTSPQQGNQGEGQAAVLGSTAARLRP